MIYRKLKESDKLIAFDWQGRCFIIDNEEIIYDEEHDKHSLFSFFDINDRIAFSDLNNDILCEAQFDIYINSAYYTPKQCRFKSNNKWDYNHLDLSNCHVIYENDIDYVFVANVIKENKPTLVSASKTDVIIDNTKSNIEYIKKYDSNKGIY